MARKIDYFQVKETTPTFVVVEELRDGRTGGIVLSRPYAAAVEDSKWGSDIRWALARTQETKIGFEKDEVHAKVGVTNASGTARIQLELRRPDEPPPPASRFA